MIWRDVLGVSFFEFVLTLTTLIAGRNYACDQPLQVFIAVTFGYRLGGKLLVAFFVLFIPRRFPVLRKAVLVLSRLAYFAFLVLGQVWYSRTDVCGPLHRYVTLAILIQQLYIISALLVLLIVGAVMDLCCGGGCVFNRSVSPHTIRQLQQEVLNVNLEEKCSICIEDFKTGDTATHLPCEHRFHPGCIEPWLATHDTCPLCRATVVNPV